MNYPKGDQPEDLLRAADDATYQGKTGRQSKVYVPTPRNEATSNFSLGSCSIMPNTLWKEDMQRGVAEISLYLDFQSITLYSKHSSDKTH